MLLFVCLPKDGNIQVVHLQHRLQDALQSRGIVAAEELQQRIRDVILRRKPKVCPERSEETEILRCAQNDTRILR